MTTQTQSQAAPAPKADAKPKLVLAMISPDVAQAAGAAIAKAVVTCEKAKRTMLASLMTAVAGITVPISAAQYDRQVMPHIKAGFARSVARKDISEKTASQYGAKLKTAVLALVNKVAAPISGETFWEFYDRASVALVAAKLADGSPVWEAASKRGPKAGKAKASKPKPVAQDAEPLSASKGEAGFNRSPALAAALILTGGNETRASRLIAVLETYTSEFDRWSADILQEKSSPAQTVLQAAMAQAEAKKAAKKAA